jgi:hypothetical protein
MRLIVISHNFTSSSVGCDTTDISSEICGNVKLKCGCQISYDTPPGSVNSAIRLRTKANVTKAILASGLIDSLIVEFVCRNSDHNCVAFEGNPEVLNSENSAISSFRADSNVNVRQI